MKRALLYLLPLVLLAFAGCRQCRWCAVPREMVAGQVAFVEPHEVEFRPMLPDTPGTRIVGRFLLDKDSAADLEDEDCLQEVRRRAAAMGGNVIVYLYPGVDYAAVAYAPELQQENLHANDDLALLEE
ncbi:MAG: hypothetical protein IKY91_00015 [Akkermansia sp.]|nr:hypothetical protein [Akkermansia sp.]